MPINTCSVILKILFLFYSEADMTSLSEAYVNYCISTEGLELDNNLAEVFTQESSSTEPYGS